MSEQAYKTPLVDMLRNVPKDHRTEWPIQWAENGAETGHALCPIGKLAHEAADRIAELEAAQAQAVNQQLLEALQKTESHLHAMMAHIDHKPQRFQEHCWQQVLDIRAAIAAAQEQK